MSISTAKLPASGIDITSAPLCGVDSSGDAGRLHVDDVLLRTLTLLRSRAPISSEPPHLEAGLPDSHRRFRTWVAQMLPVYAMPEGDCVECRKLLDFAAVALTSQMRANSRVALAVRIGVPDAEIARLKSAARTWNAERSAAVANYKEHLRAHSAKVKGAGW